MSLPNIAFLGRARSGKDTAAAALVAEHAYTRVAFADPLKEMALAVDPLITTYISDGARTTVRLSSLVADVGWEHAKDTYPEVRRTLQRLGAAVREHDEDFWLEMALQKFDGAASLNMPVVVTDCRYPNEFHALRRWGFLMVRLVRPTALSTHGNHASETALDDFPVDETVHNISSLDALRGWVVGLPYA
ncbi:deoxynucleotide monophosphate kinase family protein [Streptomyces sp. NPDC055006]